MTRPDFPSRPSLASSNPNALAADLTVGSAPCTYPTIAEAMTAAHDGDRLLIEGGVTFYEYLSVQKSLTLQGGYAGCGSGSSARTTIDGGGDGRVMYIYKNLNITLENLKIVNGRTTLSGAGIYVSQNTRLTGANLEIAYNTVTGPTAEGGGLRILGATVILTDTDIHHNTAPSGAGVHAESVDVYAPTLELRESSSVYNNTASGNGGGIDMSGGSISLTNDSNIYSNTAGGNGGGIDMSSGSILHTNGSDLYNNTAGGSGGGIYATTTSSIELQNQVELYANTANGGDPTSNGGGGVYLDASSLEAYRSSIRDNTASRDGGGIYATNSSTVYMGLGDYACEAPPCSQLSNNTSTATFGGGASARSGSTIELHQTFVENNQAHYGGGGLYANNSTMSLYNTVLAYNNATSTTGGDGLHLFTGAALSGEHNTFVRNNAGGTADGIAISLSVATLSLRNSIIWGHATSINDATQTVTCSDIQGGYTGAGNIDQDPLFMDPGAGDFHLVSTSPAVDACATGLNADLDGRGRPAGAGYDMGADEFEPFPPSFTSTPPTQVEAGQSYTYLIAAEDANGDPIAITAACLPTWLALVDHGDGTATLSGTPTLTNLGDNAVTLRVADNSGLYATQSFVIQVSGAYRIYLPITIR